MRTIDHAATRKRPSVHTAVWGTAVLAVALVLAAVVLAIHHPGRAAPAGGNGESSARPGARAPTTTPTTPTATGLLGRPMACPAGAVGVSPGHVPGVLTGNTNYCFSGGTYARLALHPQNGDHFFGRGRAVLDGGHAVVSAFSGSVSNATIDGFTIRNYSTATTYQSPGVIDLFSGSHDTVSHNSIGPDSTTGVRFGAAASCCGPMTTGSGVDDSIITHNVIHDVGYSGTAVLSGNHITVSYNDVSGTDLFGSDTENDVAALGKFANDENTAAVGNWVHDNGDTAIWFDVFNYDITIAGNHVGPDNRVGIFYELSYNATISGNDIEGNGRADAGDGLVAPGAGIRVSAAGYKATDPGPHGVFVSHNTLTGNHEGIVLYDGHGTGLPVNHTSVSDNNITSTDSGTDAWAAYTAETGRENSFDGNTYNVAQDLFADPTAADWSAWQRSGLDRGSTCRTTLGQQC